MIIKITDYGKKVKMRLIELDKPQKWLIEQVAEKTGLYFDDSYLHKVLTGERNSDKIVGAINEILWGE